MSKDTHTNTPETAEDPTDRTGMETKVGVLPRLGFRSGAQKLFSVHIYVYTYIHV